MFTLKITPTELLSFEILPISSLINHIKMSLSCIKRPPREIKNSRVQVIRPPLETEKDIKW